MVRYVIEICSSVFSVISEVENLSIPFDYTFECMYMCMEEGMEKDCFVLESKQFLSQILQRFKRFPTAMVI